MDTHRSWYRRAVAVAAALGVMAACTPAPGDDTGTGDVLPGAPSSRDVVTRDIDDPADPDCANWRYDLPNPDEMPADYEGEDYRYTSVRSAQNRNSIHHICGQRGPAIDLAWGLQQGRSDVLIAVLDSGIEWRGGDMADLASQAWLNAGELPVPLGASSHDANGDGHVSIDDYALDPRVTDRNGSEMLDPEDLILDPFFSDGVDDDGNGYVDDISGWDFLFGDNNPLDDVEYGHGTGEAKDSVARDGNGGPVGVCPGCRFLPVRVGDSFIAEGGRFAAGVLFAVDSGADVVQEALGAINDPPQAQAAIDAAYHRGIPVVASMADEASKHPNLPAAMNHTIPVNSITSPTDTLGDIGQPPIVDNDFLQLNGCTNYGAITWVSVPSSSCSSEATGLGAGMVGLIESAARDVGLPANPSLGATGPGDNVLTANEVAQILRATADDVDFATPNALERANDRGGDPFTRYPTTPGWDATFGFGRVNTFEAVRATSEGEIPPEADLTSPEFFALVPGSGSLAVEGYAAAARSASYTWRVEWTTGLQSDPHPATDDWRVAATGSASSPTSGTLATLDLAAIAAALPGGGSGASGDVTGPDEDRFAVRVRLVVTDAEGRHGVSQRGFFVHDDPDRELVLPMEGPGGPSPAFADVDGVPGDELVLAGDDGVVHVWDSSGSDIAGWPNRTDVASWWPTGSPTAAADGIEPAHDPIGVGAPVIADLDGDSGVEIAVTDGGGTLWVWNADGSLRARMDQNPAFADQSASNDVNRLKPGFFAAPAAGDLDGDGDLELVVAALDRHVYAWHDDGAPVDGFPVLVVDPRTTASVDPVSHQVTFNTDDIGLGGELIATPAVGDLDGDGRAEIVVGAQEQYDEQVSVFPPVGLGGVSGNARVYAIHPDGTAHADPVDEYPGHPDEQAYLDGWPVRLAMILEGILPLIGNGVATQAAIGEVDGDPEPEVVVASAAGPVYVLDVDGKTAYGRELGLDVVLDWLGSPFGANANSSDGGVMGATFGGPALGNLRGSASEEVAITTVGIRQALDQLLAGDQLGDTQLMAWDGTTRSALPGFPRITSDLGFFVTPAIADIDGDGDAEVIATNGVQLVDAFDAQGNAAPGYPKLTGGWSVGTPGLGDWDNDGTAEMAIVRRDGTLLVFSTAASAASLTEWPRFGHDGRNSGDARTTP